jgi:hypothetical protein
MKTSLRKKMKFVHWAGIGTAIGIFSVAAHAGTRRTPAAGYCQVYSGVAYLNSSYQVSNDGIPATLICPVVNDTAIPTGVVNGISVHGWSAGAGGLQASACVIYSGGNGGDCGLPTSSTGAGVGISIVDRSKWTSFPSDYPYIKVTLGSGSNVWGTTYTTP